VHPMRVVGVRVELPANQPVVLLREEDGVRYLPIWIGAAEASAIAFQQQGVQTVRPLTHDLMRDIIGALGARLEAVHITEMREDIYYAELRFSGGVTVSARPSDAIALALRCDVEILGSDEVLDTAGIEIPDDAAAVAEEPGEDAEDQVEKFREFLDKITPEDFASGT
jgi:bifunctional DNase/RNase